MMLNTFNNWQSSVKSLNNDAVALDDARRKCYEWMSDKIKASFRSNGMPIPAIHFTSDGSKIECTWNRGIGLFIPVDLIVNLHMGFDFDVEIKEDGEWVKKLTFYPFKEVVK